MCSGQHGAGGTPLSNWQRGCFLWGAGALKHLRGRRGCAFAPWELGLDGSRAHRVTFPWCRPEEGCRAFGRCRLLLLPPLHLNARKNKLYCRASLGPPNLSSLLLPLWLAKHHDPAPPHFSQHVSRRERLTHAPPSQSPANQNLLRHVFEKRYVYIWLSFVSSQALHARRGHLRQRRYSVRVRERLLQGQDAFPGEVQPAGPEVVGPLRGGQQQPGVRDADPGEAQARPQRRGM